MDADPVPREALDAAEAYALERMRTNEGSHDFGHARRVLHHAKQICAELLREGATINEGVVAISALLHDVFDAKLYTGDEPGEILLGRFLRSLELAPEHIAAISRVVRGISFSKQMASSEGECPRSLEMDVVQDADRLDAIGAIGIARCFAYGGAKRTSLQSSRLHFEEKILRLESLMRTAAGKRMAAERHRFVCTFLETLDEEFRLTGQNSLPVQHGENALSEIGLQK